MRSSPCPPPWSACAVCAPTSRPAPLVLAATDPANPYGATLPWPKREGSSRRPSRVPGAYVVTVDAEPVLYLERGGKGLLPLVEPADELLREALEALAEAVRRGRVPRLGIERSTASRWSARRSANCCWSWASAKARAKLTLSA